MDLILLAYTHSFCLLARKRLRRRDNLGCPSQSRDSTDAFDTSTHGSHSVRTSIVCIYNISVSTYCCFAVVLSVPRAALAGHIFTATKRLQKQGLKTYRNQTLQREHTHIYTASPHGSHSACADMLMRAVRCERTHAYLFFGSTHGSHSACTGMLVRSNCLALFSFLGGLPEDYFLIA